MKKHILSFPFLFISFALITAGFTIYLFTPHQMNDITFATLVPLCYTLSLIPYSEYYRKSFPSPFTVSKATADRYIVIFRVSLVLIHLYLLFYLASAHFDRTLPRSFLVNYGFIILINLVYITYANYITKTEPNHLLGIQTYWNKNSESNWTQTQRFCSIVIIVESLLFIVLFPYFFSHLDGKILVMLAGMQVIFPIAIGYVYSFIRAKVS